MSNLDVFDLEGTTALVTGSLGMIGREVADALAQSGSDLGLLDSADPKRLEDQAGALEDQHDIEALDLPADVTDADGISTALDRLEAVLGPPDVLVHLAAIDAKADEGSMDAWGDLRSFPQEAWDASVDVNLTGTFLLTREVVNRMVDAGGGHVILVGSTYSLVAPNPALYNDDTEDRPVPKTKPPDYVATKSAIPNLTRYIATSFAEANVRANCIVPHGVDDGGHDEAFRGRFAELSPLGRMCDPEELRGPFVFLASDASSYMTGSVLKVDGGWTAW